MSWQGANVSSRRKRAAREKESQRSSETIEATLNRLTKSYEVAIECLGACHRAAAEIKPEEEERKLPQLVNAVRTARRTFERAILNDPLVSLYAPCLAQLWQDSSNKLDQNAAIKSGWIPSLSRVKPPILTSGTHRETVKKLSYLSLLNYADLLLSGCFGCEHDVSATRLDRRVVDPIYRVNSPFSCWNGVEVDEPGEKIPPSETESDTVRLALVSYMDAAQLDGSDPTVWFRMGVAARHLDNLLGGKPRYRRLERHALESAQACWLSRHRPPNRTILNAWNEWQKSNDSDWKKDEVYQQLSKKDGRAIVTLSLGRYSWVVLGRSLIRACREGSEFRSIPLGLVPNSRDTSRVGVNPNLVLRISPLLTLPAKVVENTISFLSDLETRQLECTCRALSVAVLSARTKTDHSKDNLPSNESENAAQDGDLSKDASPGLGFGFKQDKQNDAVKADEGAVVSTSNEVEKSKPTKDTKSVSVVKDTKNLQASRVSKRLKSQLLNSGRRTEREHRRSSVRYCLVGATMGISSENKEWKKIEEKQVDSHGEPAIKARKQRMNAMPNLATDGDIREDVERVSSASLQRFIASRTPATPAATAAAFLSHISIHVNAVYSNESHGTILLSSCLVDVFEVLKHWRGVDGSQSRFNLSPIQYFAMNLLRCELWMKRCENNTNVDTSYEGDIAAIGRAIPNLMDFIEETNTASSISEDLWISMKVRCHWLASTFLLWRARSMQGAPGVREAEGECLAKVDLILDIFAQCSIKEVWTPHLEGPGRVGSYWKKLSPSTLNAFQSAMKASSVVLVAQEQFIDAVSEIQLGSDSDGFSGSQKILSKIGEALLNRYEDSGSNTIELIEDFVSFHGNELSNFNLSHDKTAIVEWFFRLVPSGQVNADQLVNLKRPCILTILAACLSSGEAHARMQLGRVLLNILLALSKQREGIELPSGVKELVPSEENSIMSDDFSAASDDSESISGEKDSDIYTKSKMYSRFMALVCLSLAKIGAAPVLERTKKDQRSELLACIVQSAYAFSTDSARVIPIQLEKETDDIFAYDAATEFSVEIDLALKTDNSEELHHKLCYERLCILEKISSWHERVLDEMTQKQSSHSAERKQWLLSGSVQMLRRIFLDIGIMLSEQLCRRRNRSLGRSQVVSQLGDDWVSSTCRRLLSLWEICRLRSEKEQKSALPVVLGKQLRVPLAAAIVGFCGATSKTREIKSDLDDGKDMSLMDVVDTDASAVDCLSDEFEMEELSRVVELAVQCIHLVTRAIRDEDLGATYGRKSDPPVPLVTTRVLNFFADTILMTTSGNDSDNGEEDPLWSDYKYGFRTLGAHLDKVLYRAYKILFGFNLSTLVESAGPGVNSAESRSSNKPESTEAAIHLYRCVMRACAQGKKAPPKAALMTIVSALPEATETEKSRSIRNFLFSTEPSTVLTNQRIRLLVKQSGDWEAPFRNIDSSLSEKETEHTFNTEEGQIQRVRKGLSEMVSQGALPAVDNNSDKDARAQCSQIESEVASRFEAMLYNLSRGSSCDCESWHRLSQLCLFKSDMIADRIGLTKGFSAARSFICPKGFQSEDKGIPLSSILQRQEKELELKLMGWTQSLGLSLGHFAMYTWSSFDSLKELQKTIREDLNDAVETDEENRQVPVWNEIARLYQEEKYGLWQQAWGGLFVSSLRQMALKCLGSALYIVHKEYCTDMEQSISDMITETNEAFGTALYTAISGKQMYGYPMQNLGSLQIRDMAETALLCYSVAMEEGSSNNKGEVASAGDEWHWDLIFMMGKCHEKIAGTYIEESFSPSQTRAYERSMASAFKSYSESLRQAIDHEKEGDLIVEQQGGSSHGSTEVLYRLHAARLKCHLAAVTHCDSEVEVAELEALRLTESFRFADHDVDGSGSMRDRVWGVIVDAVNAMVRCRSLHSFFHRSVYRHAQALMWAPILCNPSIGKVEGSFGDVPAARACKLRGLNSESAIESATAVISALFDKKRNQLCAVWVTSAGSGSPFERINTQVRKYDTLRGKYISAYLTCLRNVHNREELETFLRWTSSCRRDLPSYFSASAGQSGKIPNHIHDDLLPKPRSISSSYFLIGVKREVNGALAEVIGTQLQDPQRSRDQQYLENLLKLVYSCYLRLNCDYESLKKRRLRQNNNIKVVVDALIEVSSLASKSVVKNDACDWSLDGQVSARLEAAVGHCKKLFPNLSGAFLTKKVVRKKATDGVRLEANKVVGEKRKEPDGSFTVLKQFSVKVPDNLGAGETFLTEIKTGEKLKRIRLTVPVGGASNLRFNVRVLAE